MNPIINTNENYWRWMTEDGQFQATINRYYKTFYLTFLRYVDDKEHGNWHRIFEYDDRNNANIDWQVCKDYFIEIVDIGIEAFLVKYNIDLSLPEYVIKAFSLPRQKKVKRTVNKVDYDIEWSMDFNYPYQIHKPCPNHIEAGHYCSASVSVYHHNGGKYYNKVYVGEIQTFDCSNILKGYDQFKLLCSDPKLMVMEGLL